MNKLKLLRVKKGLNQLDLANELHIGQPAVSKCENGKTLPDIITLKKLAKFYDVPIEELLQETNYVETPFIKAKTSKPLTVLQRKCMDYIMNLNELCLEKAEEYLNALYNISK